MSARRLKRVAVGLSSNHKHSLYMCACVCKVMQFLSQIGIMRISEREHRVQAGAKTA